MDKIPLLGFISFYKYTMNEIGNKCLLAGGKYMLKMHLRYMPEMQPGFTYTACKPFDKNK